MQKIWPAKRVTLYYRHIEVEVDQKTVALARRHMKSLPIGTLADVRCALVLSLDAAIAALGEVEPSVDAMDAFRIDLIFLRALDEFLLDCEEHLLGPGRDR